MSVIVANFLNRHVEVLIASRFLVLAFSPFRKSDKANGLPLLFLSFRLRCRRSMR
jgi:hypothetical protein